MRSRTSIVISCLASALMAATLFAGTAIGEDTPDPSKSAAKAEEDTGSKSKASRYTVGERTFDAMLVRPMDFCGLLVSSAAFVPTVILTAPSGKESIENAYDLLVREPKENVFNRPLGEI